MPRNLHGRITRYQRWEDCQAGLISRLLLLEGLKEFGICATELSHLKHDSNRRPYLDGPLDFNLSHSGGWVICSISDTHRVGVDVEKVRPVLLDDFRQVISRTEQEMIKAESEPYRVFYDLWTRKEAVAKADGRGLFLPFTEIALHHGGANVQGCQWYTCKIAIPDDHAAYLATNKPVDSLLIRALSFD